LWRGAAARRGARALGGERVVGQPVPDLALPEQRNAEIAAHLELLAVRADAHQRAIDRAVARIQDGPVLVRQSIAPHAFDHRQAEHRFASVRAFAPVARPVLVLAGLEEDFDDAAFVDPVALDDLEPALGLTGLVVDLLPQARGGRLGGAK